MNYLPAPNLCAQCPETVFIKKKCDQINATKSHQCTLCDLKFSTHEGTIDHLNTKHSKVEVQQTENGIELLKNRYKCELCHIFSSSLVDYVQHKQMHELKRCFKDLVLRNQPYCLCCLKTEEKLFNVDQQIYMFCTGVCKEIQIKDVLDNVLKNHVSNIVFNSEDKICEECLDMILTTHNFIKRIKSSKEMLENLVSTIQKGINSNNITSDFCTMNIKINPKEIFNWKDPKLEETQNYQAPCLKNGDSDNLSDTLDNVEEFPKENTQDFKSNSVIKRKTKIKKTKKSKSKKKGTLKMKSYSPIEDPCFICKKIFTSRKLASHMQTKHKNIKACCNDCNKKYYSKRRLITHIKNNHSELDCTLCNKLFKKAKLLKSHNCTLQTFACVICKDNCVHKKYLEAFEKEFNKLNKSYKCIDCNYTYTTKRQLIDHANKYHLKLYPYLCHFCGKGFPSVMALGIHKKIHDTLECTHCKKTFKDKIYYETHTKMCQNVNKYKCDRCGSCFASEKKLENHRAYHFKNRFNCKLCSEKFSFKYDLHQHLIEIHNISGDNQLLGVKLECTICDLDFPSMKELKKHCLTHPEGSKHKCRFCGATFESKTNYHHHKARHYKEECPICKKLYGRNYIEAHIKTHKFHKNAMLTKNEHGTGREKIALLVGEILQTDKHVNVTENLFMQPKKEKELLEMEEDKYKAKQNENCNKSGSENGTLSKEEMCDICGKLISNYKNLKTHREKHKDHVQCSTCFKYLTARAMRVHNCKQIKRKRNVNQTGKLLYCNDCNYTTKIKESLIGHVNHYHLKIRPFKCHLCNRSYFSGFTLRDHYDHMHTNRRRIQCEICGRSIVSKNKLKIHMRLHTGERPFKCDFCNAGFVSLCRMNLHRVTQHFEANIACEYCPKKFHLNRLLKRHVRQVHLGLKKSVSKTEGLNVQTL